MIGAVGEEGQPPAEDGYGRVRRVGPVGRLEPGGAAQQAEVVTRGPVRDEDLRAVGIPAPLLAPAGGGNHLGGGLPGRDVIQHDPGQAGQEAEAELTVAGLRHDQQPAGLSGWCRPWRRPGWPDRRPGSGG